MKYLVIGTGRCGTGYMSQLLTACGVKCGHEEYFNPYRKADEQEFKRVQAESSWLALKHPWSFKGRKVIHVMRDPLKTWASLMRIKFFHEEGYKGHQPYVEAAYEIAPRIHSMEAPLACAVWIHEVYRRIKKMDQPVTTVKVDRLTRKQVQNLLNVDRGTATMAMRTVPNNYNSRPAGEVNDEVPKLVYDLRTEWGYE